MSESIEHESGAWLGLEGQVCVITGAGSGIGAETARQFARAGALVAILDLDGDSAASVAAEIVRSGGRAMGLQADVGHPESVAAAAAKIQTELGACRILVNNAAARHKDALLDISLAAWNRILGVNLTGALICTQAFAPQMIAAGKGGSLVHVSSIIGRHPQSNSGAYGVSKAGLVMLSNLLTVELGEHGIRSNVVSPGFTRTPANEAAYRDPETAAARAGMVPIGRVATPTDLAQVILFLASDRASYIDGQDIDVDGGVGRTLMNQVPRAHQAAWKVAQ